MPTPHADADTDRGESTHNHPADSPDAEILDRLDETGSPEPTVPVTVALPAADVERVVLERDRDVPIADWIRHAIGSRLVVLGDGWADAELINDDRVEYPRDTPEATIDERRREAGRRDWIPVTIGLPRRWLERIDRERRQIADTPIADWIRDAVWKTFDQYDQEIDLALEATVDVPQEIVERAQLERDHARAVGRDVTLDEVLSDYVLLDVVWTVDGEPLQDVVNEAPDR